MNRSLFLSGAAMLSAMLVMGHLQTAVAADAAKAEEIPTFKYDPDWPKTLPNGYITGNIGAMYIDKDDHIWVLQRPSMTTSLGERDLLEGKGTCCTPAPPVMEFDLQGNLLNTWGPIHITDKDKKDVLAGKQVSAPYPDGVWPVYEHGIYLDYKNNLWITDSQGGSHVLKMSRDGKLLLQIGKDMATSSSDKMNLGGPAGVYVDPKSNEVFIADGYKNRRVAVFDADTGKFKRMWGAYGKPPQDPQVTTPDPDMKKRNQQFELLHCIMHSNDDLLYVCDRANSRVQVFKKDGTFVREGFVEPKLLGLGTSFALAFSPDKEQKYLYYGDGSDKKIWILRRSDLKVLGSFGAGGRNGGQFNLIHTMATDSKGNIYVGETIDNNRVQRFLFTGMKPAN